MVWLNILRRNLKFRWGKIVRDTLKIVQNKMIETVTKYEENKNIYKKGNIIVVHGMIQLWVIQS